MIHQRPILDVADIFSLVGDSRGPGQFVHRNDEAARQLV
jgi:hypothetical protein